MRKITSSQADLNKMALALSGYTLEQLAERNRPVMPPKKHDSHVSAQFVGEWMAGCNSHVELWHETLDSE